MTASRAGLAHWAAWCDLWRIPEYDHFNQLSPQGPPPIGHTGGAQDATRWRVVTSFGHWETIHDTPELAPAGKFYLEEGKKTDGTPPGTGHPISNAIHLVQRGDYLLGVLRDEHEDKA